MAQLVRGHLVRKTDFPLPSSSPLPSPSTSLQTTKVVLAAAAFFQVPPGLGGWLVATWPSQAQAGKATALH